MVRKGKGGRGKGKGERGDARSRIAAVKMAAIEKKRKKERRKEKGGRNGAEAPTITFHDERPNYLPCAMDRPAKKERGERRSVRLNLTLQNLPLGRGREKKEKGGKESGPLTRALCRKARTRLSLLSRRSLPAGKRGEERKENALDEAMILAGGLCVSPPTSLQLRTALLRRRKKEGGEEKGRERHRIVAVPERTLWAGCRGERKEKRGRRQPGRLCATAFGYFRQGRKKKRQKEIADLEKSRRRLRPALNILKKKGRGGKKDGRRAHRAT